MKTKILLIRHGESEGNRLHMFCGRTDIPLTERGRQQAQVTAEFLKDYPIDLFYSSPLSRAYDTGAAAAKYHNLPVETDDGLLEVWGGDWEGLTFDEVARLYPEDLKIWNENVGISQCTNGESVAQVQERMFACVEKLAKRHGGKTLCLTAHAMVIRCFIAKVQGLSLEELKALPWPTNASVSTVEYENGAFRLVKYSQDEHLSDLVTALPKTI